MAGKIRLNSRGGWRKTKFNAKRTKRLIDGKEVSFHSKMEAERWDRLALMEKVGQIVDLKRQVEFKLAVFGWHVCSYVCDFTYKERDKGTWIDVIEDVKGVLTDEYKIKRALMWAIRRVRIREVGANGKQLEPFEPTEAK